MSEIEQQTTPTESMSFNDMMRELESIVSALESNRLELEESLQRYERGVELLRASRARLDEAEQKVSSLIGTIEPLDDDSVDTTLS